MHNKITVVESLKEYIGCIEEISAGTEMTMPVLWFRGVTDTAHSLIPSLFRQEVRVERAGSGDYSSMHYAEDIRTQNYIAKNFHFFAKEPSSRIEWLEVMQHHRMNTRLLDWSESSIHSLLFALEPFMSKDGSSRNNNELSVPCVWVLQPGKMNKAIVEQIKKETDKVELGLIWKLLDELETNVFEKRTIMKTIDRLIDEKYTETKGTSHLDYIFNLSAINDELLRDRSRLTYLLKAGDIVNPLYYILSRIYSDGHILEERILPPLATVHPYHSERIKAQHGVFTVFPFYEEMEEDRGLRNIGFNPDAMDNNCIARDCLHKIVLCKPQKIARELLVNGMNDSWLYPEMPIVSNNIETRGVFG